MEQKSLAYAKYWRLCLADADLGIGALNRSDLEKLILRPGSELQHGRVDPELTQEFFKNSGQDVDEVEITIRPYVYYSRLEHGRRRSSGIPEVVTPIVSQGVLDRQGRIYPNENTVIPRDILEPLEADSFAIGSVTDLEIWLTSNNVPKFDKASAGHDFDKWHLERWSAYLDYCKAMLCEVAAGWPDEAAPFQLDRQWAIVKDSDVTGASKHILSLYDNIRSRKPLSPLFERYASEIVELPESCLPPNYGFSLRLGHSSSTHPLADAQRDSLTHQLVSKHGEILGVNGPPGTGKTTMLLSVVASHWVRAALMGSDPPVIAAASTNNQAVTNIIDAFSKDFSTGVGPFAGRWLPDIKSFGAYFPSVSIEKKSTGKYQTHSFFSTVEELGYYTRAKKDYLKSARVAFPDITAPSVKAISDQLRLLIQMAESTLKSIESAWQPLLSATNAMKEELGASPTASLSTRQISVTAKENDLDTYNALLEKWEVFLGNESWIYTFLSWLPPVNKKRVLLAKSFLRGLWPATFPDKQWSNVEQLTNEIQIKVADINQDLIALNAALQRGKKVMKAHREAIARWANATDCLGIATPPETRSTKLLLYYYS